MNTLVVEYFARSIDEDIDNLDLIQRAFANNHREIQYILIPQNPFNNIYPSSVEVSTILREHTGLNFIPTLKLSMCTQQGFVTIIRTLRYLNIQNVALVRGDGDAGDIEMSDALCLLHDEGINVFCAYRGTEDYKYKLLHGAREFITQPIFRCDDFLDINMNIFCNVFIANHRNVIRLADRIGFEVPKDFEIALKINEPLANALLLHEMLPLPKVMVGYIELSSLISALECLIGINC